MCILYSSNYRAREFSRPLFSVHSLVWRLADKRDNGEPSSKGESQRCDSLKRDGGSGMAKKRRKSARVKRAADGNLRHLPDNRATSLPLPESIRRFCRYNCRYISRGKRPWNGRFAVDRLTPASFLSRPGENHDADVYASDWFGASNLPTNRFCEFFHFAAFAGKASFARC